MSIVNPSVSLSPTLSKRWESWTPYKDEDP